MDSLDLKILSIYRKDTKKSAEYIGSMVGLSASAVQRRIKQLRSSGMIDKEIAELNPEKFGIQMQFIIHVDLIDERNTDIGRFENKMRIHPCVLQCYYVTGQSDFCLLIAVKSVAEFDSFTQNMLMDDDNVRSFTSSLIIRQSKQDASAFIEQLLE
ncbi:Lrp/AsnC family transcriptional regulator [Agarivorans sp. QJM3NY_25]|uniref:Lrp/AsnC family transcriptional regulator n=1 Tax=Agarivorans sp. QJM3NY_25 TaxID=3421430 RepID=UPI003D7E8655